MNWKKGTKDKDKDNDKSKDKDNSYSGDHTPSTIKHLNVTQTPIPTLNLTDNNNNSNSNLNSNDNEMSYLDTSEDKCRRKQQPPTTTTTTDNYKSFQRNVLGQSILATIRHDINDKQDTSKAAKKNVIPALNVILSSSSARQKEERREKSPKTINIGDTEQDIEYNMRTLQSNRKPKITNDQCTTTNGNIFLDLPMQSGSFIQNEHLDSPEQSGGESARGGLNPNNSGIFHNINAKEIQYTMNPRESREYYMPNTVMNNNNKMSPKQNIDDDISSIDNNNNSNTKGNDTQREYRVQNNGNKSQVNITTTNDNDGVQEVRRCTCLNHNHPNANANNNSNSNALDQVEKYIKTKEERNTLTNGEIKKLVKQITRGYDPRKGTEGRLISMNQTILHKGNDEALSERYRVLQKMNKLSSILLSKRASETNCNTNNNNTGGNSKGDNKQKTFDKKTLDRSTIGDKDKQGQMKLMHKTPQQKFLFISLAMLSSKGPHCEDRTILRKMRIEKGGVVDLAQDPKSSPKLKPKAKPKYQVKQLQRRKSPSPDRIRQKIIYNPKHRDKAAKIVQGWWRGMKSHYTKLLNKIILIQSMARGRWLRKYIYDIIFISYLHQRFVDIIEHVMAMHMKPLIWNELFSRSKMRRKALITVFGKDKKLIALRIRPYMEKWRKAVVVLLNRNMRSKKLVTMRRYNEDKKKELIKYFSIWVLRVNLSQYKPQANVNAKDKDNETDNMIKQRIYTAIGKLINGTNRLIQRQGINNIMEQLKPFLINRHKGKLIKRIVTKKPKYTVFILRKYFNKWNSITLRLHMRDLKGGLFSSTANRLLVKLIHTNMRKYFAIWKSNLPKNKETQYTRGRDLLESFVHRFNHTKPIKALIQKEDKSNITNHLNRLIVIYSRYLKKLHRDYFNQWNKLINRIKDKGKMTKMYNTLVLMLINKQRKRVLTNYFNKWKAKQPITIVKHIDNSYIKHNALINNINALSQDTLKPIKAEFLNRLQHHISRKTFNATVQKLFNHYVNQDRLFLRFYLYKWREQCKNKAVYELKVQLFKYLYNIKESRSRRMRQSETFNIWRYNAKTARLLKSANKNYQANQGLDKLNTLFHRRPMNFMIRMHKLMNKDYRPKYIESLIIRLNKPRSNLSDCFAKWKRAIDVEMTGSQMLQLKGKILKTNILRLSNRLNREGILKAFMLWRNQCEHPVEYYQKVSFGVMRSNRIIQKKALKMPFEKIKAAKNYKRRMVPLMRSYCMLKDRNDNDIMSRKFRHWRNLAMKEKVMALKSNILFKTRNNANSATKGKMLIKYFTRWKVIRFIKGNEVYGNGYKAMNLLRNFCEKSFRHSVMNSFKGKIKDVIKKRGLITLYDVCKGNDKQKTQKVYLKWYLNSKLINPNKINALRKAKLRKKVNDKEQSVLGHYFKRWLRELITKTQHLPNYTKLNKGGDIIKGLYIRKNINAFTKLHKTISKQYLNKKLISNVIPNSKLALKKSLQSSFTKWKSKVTNSKLNSLRAGLLSKVYTKGKVAVLSRMIRTRFIKWKTKDQEKKPIDLYSTITGNDIINTTLANKYLKGFLPKMKDYSTKKFLRKLIYKSASITLRRIRPYYDKWRSKAGKIKEKAITYNASSRLMNQTKKHQMTIKTIRLLTDKLSHWRLKARNDTRKINSIITDALKHMKLYNSNENGLRVIKGMKTTKRLNAKRTTMLKALPNNRARCDNSILRKYFNRFKSKVSLSKYKGMKDYLKKKLLGIILSKRIKGLLRYFLLWMNKAHIKHHETPIQLACNKIRNALIKKSYMKFIKRANMIKVLIPRGVGIKTVLVNRKVNVAKSISLRNISLRPMWNKWKKKATTLRAKNNKRNRFNKILFNKVTKGDLALLKKALYKWKHNTYRLLNKQQLKELRMKLLYRLYGKNKSICLKRYCNRWRYNINAKCNKLNAINRGALKLHHYTNQPIINQMRKMLKKNDRVIKRRALLFKVLCRNDKNNLLYSLLKWRKQIGKHREMRLKGIVLRNLFKKKHHQLNKDYNNRLKDALLRWRIKLVPKDYLARITRIQSGSDKLRSAIRKPYERNIMDQINKRGKKRYTTKLLSRLIKRQTPKLQNKMIKEGLRRWLSKLGDTTRLASQCRKLLDKSLCSNAMHKPLINEPMQDLINAMNGYHILKTDKAKMIALFTRGLLTIKNQCNILKRTVFLHKRIALLDLAIITKYSVLFTKWNRISHYIKSIEDANTIQKFLRSKINNPSDKRKRIMRGGIFLEHALKFILIHRLKIKGKQSTMQKVLRHHISNQSTISNKQLKDRFIQWRNMIPFLKQNDAARTIQNNYLNLRSRRKVTHSLNLNSNMKRIVTHLSSKYISKLHSLFIKWLNDTKVYNCNKNATLIQQYASSKLKTLLQGKSMAKLHSMFKMSYIRSLYIIMARASKIIGNKGEVLLNTIKDIYFKRPFNHFISGLKWINRISRLKQLCPKVAHCLRRHFIPNAIQIWKSNTYGNTVSKVIRIQQWFRIQIVLYKINKQYKKEMLLEEFIMRINASNDKKIAIPFKIWKKKAQLSRLNDKAITVQKIYKGKKVKQRVDVKLAQNRLCTLFKRKVYDTLIDGINQSYQCSFPFKAKLNSFKSHIENRYATNNIIDYCNEVYTNKLLNRILNRKKYYDNLTGINMYFNRWRYANNISHKAIVKIQNASRNRLAYKKRQSLEILKQRLLYYVLKAIDCDNNKVYSAFRKINLKTQLDKCNDMSTLIQDYLTPKLDRYLNRKYRLLFFDLNCRLRARRINQAAKINRLKRAIYKSAIGFFINQLKQEDNQCKLRLRLIKKFNLIDSTMLRLSLGRHFAQWRNQIGEMNNLRGKKAIIMQRNVRGHLAIVSLKKIQKRNGKLLNLLLRIINNKDLKRHVAFSLWRTNVQTVKLDDAVNILHSYIKSILNKINIRNKDKKSVNLTEGFNHLCTFTLTQLKQDAYNKIKSESNSKTFTKMNNTLITKRKDHLSTSLKSIKAQNKLSALMNIITIPNAIKNKILRQVLIQWANTSTNMSKLKAIKTIQSNYRKYLLRQSKTHLNTLLSTIISQKMLKYSNILKYYLSKWHKNTQKKTVLRAGRKINRFISNQYSISKAKKNYYKLTLLLHITQHNYAALNIIKRIKYSHALIHLLTPIEYYITDYGYNKLIANIKLIKISKKLTPILTNVNKRKEFIALYDYFNHWRYQIMKLEQKDDVMTKLVALIDNRAKVIQAKCLNDAFLIKKLFAVIPKIRAIEFYRRLRLINKGKKAIKEIGDRIAMIYKDTKYDNSHKIARSIYRLYSYHLISKMIKSIDDYWMNKVNSLIKAQFIKRLIKQKHFTSAYAYNENRKGSRLSKVISLSFKAKITNPKNIILNSDNKYMTLKKVIMPYLVNYLNKKYHSRIRDALGAIRFNHLSSLFCSLYRSYVHKTLLIKPKRDLYEAMLKESTKGSRLIRLYNLFKRSYIRHIVNSIKLPIKTYKIMYMIRMTILHKKVASKRFIIELIRKWRFISFAKAMTRKKLELMYKNFHTSYLQMANDVFGDDNSINPSVVKEFERFGSNIGMFTNEKPQKEEELGKDYCKTIKKKYVFQANYDYESNSGSGEIKEEDTNMNKNKDKDGNKEEGVEEIDYYYYIEDDIRGKEKKDSSNTISNSNSNSISNSNTDNKRKDQDKNN